MDERHSILLHQDDITNLRKKHRHSKLDETQQALSYLKSLIQNDPGADVNIVRDDDGFTSVIFIQTSDMKATFKKYGELLFLDSTYKINKNKMPVYNFMNPDSNNKGKICAHAIVMNESSENVENLLTIFSANNDTKTVRSVVIDKDFS